jgi:hypothetical protein
MRVELAAADSMVEALAVGSAEGSSVAAFEARVFEVALWAPAASGFSLAFARDSGHALPFAIAFS